MKKTLIALASLALAHFASASPAATVDWVRQYVATQIAEIAATTYRTTSNRVVHASAGTGEAQAVVRREEYDCRALFVTNSVCSVPNKTYFIWDGNGAFVSSNGTITATSSNFVFNGVSSISTNGLFRFNGLMDVRCTLVQKSFAYSATNGISSVSLSNIRVEDGPIERIANAVFRLFVPCALADYTDWFWPDNNVNVAPQIDPSLPVTIEAYDAKTKEWTSVSVETKYDEASGTYVIDPADVQSAFSEISKNMDTVIAALGSALSGVIEVASVANFNQASIETLAKNLENAFVTVTTGSGRSKSDIKVQHAIGSASGVATSFHVPEYSVKNNNDVFYITKDGTETGDGWVQGTAVDNKTLENFKDEKIYRTRLKGWNDEDGSGKLSDALKSESATTASSYDVVVRTKKDGNIAYMPIGYGIGTPAWVTNALPKITNSWDMVTNAIPMITNSVEFVTNSVSVISNLVNNLEMYTNTTVKTTVTNLVENYTVITGETFKVNAFTNWNVMVNFTSNFSTRVIEQVDKLVNVTTNVIAKETSVVDFVTNNLDVVNYWCTNEYHVVTNSINVVTNTMQVVTNYMTTTRAILGLPEIEWNPQDPEYDPYEDPYNPISPDNPINDPDWKDNPENPFYDSAIGELERQMDDVTNKLVSASNELHKISGGYNWVTNNFDDITNSINVLKSFKNNVKIYNAISNGTYVSMYLDHKSIGTNESGLAEMKGFGENPTHTYPVKRYYSDGTSYILWTPMPRLDSQYMPTSGDGLADKGMSFSSIENTTSSGTMGTTNVLSLYGFSSTEKGQIPFVNIWGTGVESIRRLAWANASSNQFEITHVGTYGEEESHDINLKGFESASEGYVPYKKKVSNSNPAEYEICWTNLNVVTGVISVNGAVGTNFVFEAGSNSNLSFTPEVSGGVIHVKVDVMWKD